MKIIKDHGFWGRLDRPCEKCGRPDREHSTIDANYYEKDQCRENPLADLPETIYLIQEGDEIVWCGNKEKNC
ncbi:MAG: hypothetical protein PVG39_00725 [Desulfobacteraceae bacterium]|jgi:hypothetical protein